MARLLHLVFESRDQDGRDELRRFLAFMRGSIDRALVEIDSRDQKHAAPKPTEPERSYRPPGGR